MEQVPLTEKLGDEQLELVTLSAFEPADAYDLDAERHYAALMCPASQGRRGGTGTVREAYTTAFEHVALKTMAMPDKPLFREGEYEHELKLRLAAFREEYETLLKLRVMRAFPTVFGYGMLDDVPAIVMEWIEGTSLAELKGKLSTDEVTRLARATYLLLEQVEGQVAVFAHRDIAPGNIIIRTVQRPLDEQLESGIFDLCLVDLGSTTVAREVGKSFTTRVGALRGATPAYAAPEMLSLETAADVRRNPKVDVYAVSSVMWELLTGELPYGDDNVDGLIRAKREGAPEVPAAIDEDAAKLARILVKGMDPSQETRPASHDMRAWLDDLLTGKPGFWDGETEAKPLITRRKFLIGVGVAAAAAGIALVVPRLTSNDNQQERQSDETMPKHELLGLDYYAPLVSLDEYKGPLLPCMSEFGTWGYCTTDTEWAILPNYDEVSYFSGGLAAVKREKSKLYGFIDTHGEEAIEAQFLDVQPFGQTSLAAAQSERGGWGFIDRFGNWEIEPIYNDAGEFTDTAPVQDLESGLWGFIDRNAAWVVEPSFGVPGAHLKSAGSFRNGLAPVRMSSGRWMYMRGDGSLIDDQEYVQAGEFFEGYARVAKENIISVDGYLIDAAFGMYGSSDYTDVGRVSQGMFAVRHTDGGWGFGSVSGWRVTIPPAFRGVGRFIQGLALVQDFATRRWGYIDMLGNSVVEPIMSGVLGNLTEGGGTTA